MTTFTAPCATKLPTRPTMVECCDWVRVAGRVCRRLPRHPGRARSTTMSTAPKLPARLAMAERYDRVRVACPATPGRARSMTMSTAPKLQARPAMVECCDRVRAVAGPATVGELAR